MRAAAIRKAVVAAIGVGFILAAEVLDAFVGLQDGLVLLVDGILGVLTAFGVFQVENEQPVVAVIEDDDNPDEGDNGGNDRNPLYVS